MPILKYPGENHVTLDEIKKRAAGGGTPPANARVLTSEGQNETERSRSSWRNWPQPPRAALKRRKGK